MFSLANYLFKFRNAYKFCLKKQNAMLSPRTPQWYFLSNCYSPLAEKALKEHGAIEYGLSLAQNIGEIARSKGVIVNTAKTTLRIGAETDFCIRTGKPTLLFCEPSTGELAPVHHNFPANTPNLACVNPEEKLEEAVQKFCVNALNENPQLSGAYIVIEGLDGAGKTTHARLLVSYLEQKGIETIYVREPGATKLAEIVRAILLNTEFDHLTPQQNFLLFSLARSSLCREIIIPALQAGRIVVSDRNYFSSIAYQGFGERLGTSEINLINHWVMNGIFPDLSFIIDADPAEVLAKARAKGKIERFEKEEFEFHERVRQGYLMLATLYGSTVITYRPGKNDEMQLQIREKVDSFLASQTP